MQRRTSHLVQKFRGEIGAVGPDHCSKFGVQTKLAKVCRVFKRFKNRAPQFGRKINYRGKTIDVSQFNAVLARICSGIQCRNQL